MWVASKVPKMAAGMGAGTEKGQVAMMDIRLAVCLAMKMVLWMVERLVGMKDCWKVDSQVVVLVVWKVVL